MGKSVWDDLYDDPAEALDKKRRSALLIEIVKTGRTLDQSLAELAMSFGVSNGKAKSIMNGYMDKFTEQELCEICANLGIDHESVLQEIV